MLADIVKLSILPRTCFENISNFRKRISQNFIKWLEIWLKFSYIIFKRSFSQCIIFYPKITVINHPQSRNFHNSQKFPRTMSARLRLFPSLLIFLIFNGQNKFWSKENQVKVKRSSAVYIPAICKSSLFWTSFSFYGLS